jgi:hypothetical protein
LLGGIDSGGGGAGGGGIDFNSNPKFNRMLLFIFK